MYGLAVLLVLSAISVQYCASPLEEWFPFPFHLPWFGQSVPEECQQTCDNLNVPEQRRCCTKHEKCCPPEKQGLCPMSEIMVCAKKTFLVYFSVSVACTFDNNCSGTMKCCPTSEFRKCCVESLPASDQGGSSGTIAVSEPAPDQKTGTQPVQQSKPEAGEGKPEPAEGKLPELGVGKPEPGEGKPESGEGKPEPGEGKQFESGEGKPELGEGNGPEPPGQENGPESSQGSGSQANQGNESHNGSDESI